MDFHYHTHTATSFFTTDWSHPYTRESIAYHDEASRHHKYWPGTRNKRFYRLQILWTPKQRKLSDE